MLWEGLCNSCPECRKTVDPVQAGIKPPFHFSKPSLGETVHRSFLRELVDGGKAESFLPDFKNSLPIPGTNDIFLPHCKCAVSSVVEHMLHTHGVTGSKPVPRTIFLNTPEFNISGCFMFRTIILPRFWVILHVPDYMLCAVGIDLVFLSPYASAHMPRVAAHVFHLGVVIRTAGELPVRTSRQLCRTGTHGRFICRFSPLRPEGAPQPCRGDDGDRRRPVRRDVSFLYRCLPLSAFPPGCPFTATTPIYVVLIDGLMKRIFRRSIWRRLFLQPWEGRESFGKDIPPVTGS